MNPSFAQTVEKLHPSFEILLATQPITNAQFIKNMPKKGIYLFTEKGRHLYVGRSNNIRGRYGRHCSPGATHRMAAFAFRLAREATGKTKPSYKAGNDSRSGLMNDPTFANAFKEAKMRIREMEFRCVTEEDPVCQTLLEVYCAIVLRTPYNDFDNH